MANLVTGLCRRLFGSVGDRNPIAGDAVDLTIEHTRWYAVRCCCTPAKVLGFMQLPVEAEHRRAWSVPARGGVATLELRPIATYEPADAPAEIGVRAEVAIFSDDRPREFWRGVVGFVEASE